MNRRHEKLLVGGNASRIGTALLILFVAFGALGCSSAGAGGDSPVADSPADDPPASDPVTISLASPPMIPGSLTGGAASASGSVIAALEFVEDYEGQKALLEEYGSFIIIPETAMNYNETMEGFVPGLTEWVEQMGTDEVNWQPSTAPYAMERDFLFPEWDNKGTVKVSEDLSHIEIVMSSLAGENTMHYEVREYDGYTHGFMFAYRTSGDDAVDTVDIVSTPDWTFTKTVRIFDFENTMDGDGQADLVSFAGINRNDTHERVLGILKRESVAYGLDDYAFTESVVSVNGAFDSAQLAIRPPERPTSPLTLWTDHYPETGTDDQGIALFGSQSETFDPSVFPAVGDVERLFDVGITVSSVDDWVINSDLSRNYTFPEWDPAEVGFTGLTP
jgi:hypothetical protein